MELRGLHGPISVKYLAQCYVMLAIQNCTTTHPITQARYVKVLDVSFRFGFRKITLAVVWRVNGRWKGSKDGAGETHEEAVCATW